MCEDRVKESTGKSTASRVIASAVESVSEEINMVAPGGVEETVEDDIVEIKWTI